MGNQDTFKISSVLFYLIGAGFGTSYSMTQVDLLGWINTNPYLKLLRVCLGIGSYIAIFSLFDYFREPSFEDKTDYFFFAALPQFLISSWVYGPLVLICDKMKLVKRNPILA